MSEPVEAPRTAGPRSRKLHSPGRLLEVGRRLAGLCDVRVEDGQGLGPVLDGGRQPAHRSPAAAADNQKEAQPRRRGAPPDHEQLRRMETMADHRRVLRRRPRNAPDAAWPLGSALAAVDVGFRQQLASTVPELVGRRAAAVSGPIDWRRAQRAVRPRHEVRQQYLTTRAARP